MCHNIECRCIENLLYNKVLRIYVTKLFSLADPGGGVTGHGSMIFICPNC